MKSILIVCITLLLTLSLQACTTGTEAFKEQAEGGGKPESIALLEPITLGGSQQWLLIRGEDKSKPILLFLHGGPGSPYIGLAHTFQRELEKHFVVVQWDQRGSGKSFPGTPPASMTVAQFQADTHELILKLRERFVREKIYLAGHSWGAYLGLAEAHRYPENLYAYIGTGQMIDLVKQEQMSHDFVLEHARKENNEKVISQLNEIGYPPYADAVKGMETKYGQLWEYGGMIDGASGPSPFVKALIKAREYSLWDITKFVRGMSFSLQNLADNEGKNFWNLKAPDTAIAYRVPVFFITGENDRVTPLPLIRDYTAALQAPMKASFVIKNLGHFAFFKDSAQFSGIMVDILKRTQDQAASMQASRQ
jgi:pimeloyl-ACP methyl ester carboxylesterase